MASQSDHFMHQTVGKEKILVDTDHVICMYRTVKNTFFKCKPDNIRYHPGK